VGDAGYSLNDHAHGGPASTKHLICGYGVRPSVFEQIVDDGHYSTRRRFAPNFGTVADCQAAAVAMDQP